MFKESSRVRSPYHRLTYHNRDMGALTVQVKGDSFLVLNQLSGKYKCESWNLRAFHSAASQLLRRFDEVELMHLPRACIAEANDLAQAASGLKVPQGLADRVRRIEKISLPSVEERGILHFPLIQKHLRLWLST